MQNTPQYVAAIDVGTTKIVTLLGKRTENGKLEVVGHSRSDSKGIKRGEVLNPEEASQVVKETLIDLQERTGVVFSEVFVGIAGHHIRILKSRHYINRASYDDSITAEDINQLKSDANKIALEEGKEIIHILPQSYIVDNETDITNPVGMLGKRLEANFNIVVGNIDSIKRIKKCIHHAGLTIREIVLEPLASADAVLFEEEREAGVALVDIGGGTTDVAVFYENVLRHSAVIPFGGNVVTKDVKDACGLIERHAEEVKIQFGMALSEVADENKVIVIPGIPGRDPKEISFRNLAHIIQSRMEEIIDAIMFHIENSGCMDKLGAGIVITGGGAMLKHLKQLFHYRTGMDVRIGYPGEHLAGNAEAINEPCYATGIGLLMKGFEYMDLHQSAYIQTQSRIDVVKPITPIIGPEPEEEELEDVLVRVRDVDPKEKGKERKQRKGISLDFIKERIVGYFDTESDSDM